MSKEQKALEIIRKKYVDIHDLAVSDTLIDYNNKTHWLGSDGNLTQEEYDLLKEVLK